MQRLLHRMGSLRKISFMKFFRNPVLTVRVASTYNAFTDGDAATERLTRSFLSSFSGLKPPD
jgi:hypothetical protein